MQTLEEVMRIANDWFDLRDADWQTLSPIDLVVQFYFFAQSRISGNSEDMSLDDWADLYRRAATPKIVSAAEKESE